MCRALGACSSSASINKCIADIVLGPHDLEIALEGLESAVTMECNSTEARSARKKAIDILKRLDNGESNN